MHRARRNASGLENIEVTLRDAEATIELVVDPPEVWTYVEDHPHIARFAYQVRAWYGDSGEAKVVGTVDGYRITHDCSDVSDLALWQEADAIDGDVVSYVESLIRECRAYEAVNGLAPDLSCAQRITLVRHFEPRSDDSAGDLFKLVVAALAMMDAPVFMLVDPRMLPEQRQHAQGKMRGRGHFARLMELGFTRMIASRYAWAWDRAMAEGMLEEYDYERLLLAKQRGTLDAILESRIAQEIHPGLSDELADSIGMPDERDTED